LYLQTFCSVPLRNSSIQTNSDPIQCNVTCTAVSGVIQTKHSSLPPKGKPGFHAEWLRDGPCDATTTCLGKPGVWCQLSLAGKGGEHEIRGRQAFIARRLLRFIESFQVRSLFEPVTCPQFRSHLRMRGTLDDCVLVTMSGMRQDLRSPAAFDLR
jgi:hypothetical protein